MELTLERNSFKSFGIKVLALIIAIATMFTVFVSPVQTHAANYGASYEELVTTLISGKYYYQAKGKQYNFSSNSYKLSGGGYTYWYNLFNGGSDIIAGTSTILNDSILGNLTSSAKNNFLTDMFTLANAMADDTEKGNNTASNAVTSETVSDFMEILEQQAGLGATLLATLLQNTKPDYVSANNIYEPFSGVVGTILGIISILIMALLGVTMALDLAYITIPAFQMALGGTDEAGHGDKTKGIGRIISQEAKKAVQASEGGQGGQAGTGEYKAAVGIYFKYRWKGLVILGICLLYLVQGQIYNFVGWFIDLFSGFLGF